MDVLAKYRATVTVDLLQWEYQSALLSFLEGRGSRDLVVFHASPPCTEYSRAKTKGVRDLKKADLLVKRVLEILSFVNPDYWTLENPVGLLRTRSFMKSWSGCMHTCSYCKYGTSYRKNTNIWTNATCSLRKCCKASPCRFLKNGVHIRTAQCGTGKRTFCKARGCSSREKLYALPYKLVKAIYAGVLR